MPKNKGTRPGPVVTVRRTKHVLSNEDWYPTLEGKVRVSLIGWSDGAWRVCVWGGDDFGLERDWASSSGARHEARQQFDRIVHLTTQAELRARGFVNA